MRHRNTTKTLDRKAGPRKALLLSLVQSVLLYEKIQTTEAKAKAVRSLLERVIHVSKDGTLQAHRQLLACLPSPLAAKKAIEVIGPRYRDREGGYVRLTAIGYRKGDGAEMVQIELV